MIFVTQSSKDNRTFPETCPQCQAKLCDEGKPKAIGCFFNVLEDLKDLIENDEKFARALTWHCTHTNLHGKMWDITDSPFYKEKRRELSDPRQLLVGLTIDQ